MPLCGTKKSKKQKRDPSPSYGQKEKEDNEERERLIQQHGRRVQELEKEIQTLREDVKLEKNKNRVLREENSKLKELPKEDKAKKTNEEHVTASDLPHHEHDHEKARVAEELQTKTKELEEKNKENSNLRKELERLQKQLKEERETPKVLAGKGEGEETAKVKDTLLRTQAELETKTNDIAKLTEELKVNRQKLEAEQSRLAKLEEEREKLKRDKDSAESKLVLTTKELEIAKRESHIPRSPTRAPSDEWIAKINAAEAELKKERDLRLEKEKEITRMSSDKTLWEKEKSNLQGEIQKIKSEKEELIKTKKEELENSIRNLELNHKNDSKRMEDMIDGFKKKLDESENTNEKLLTRLSAQTAAHVLDNNPNVSDLSDPNRPQKLGEQLAQVYDDQWTDATEALEKLDKNEEEILKILLDLLIIIYKHCKEAAENQLSRVEEDIFLPPLESPTSPTGEANGTDPSKSLSSSKHSSSKIPRFTSHKGRAALPNLTSEKKTIVKGEKVPELPTEVRKGIKEYRKKVTKQVWPVIEKEVLTKLRKNDEFDEKVIEACTSYITKCVELCWLMRVQDPPVCLTWDVPEDKSFNTEVYRAYTKSGHHIEYVVWPAMYLYEGGPVLMKGVAQGDKK